MSADIAVLPDSVQVHHRLFVHLRSSFYGYADHMRDGGRGSEVSPGCLRENGFLQTQVRNHTFKPSVFFLQVFQPLELLSTHTAVFFTPAIVRLFCHSDLPTGRDDAFALAY